MKPNIIEPKKLPAEKGNFNNYQRFRAVGDVLKIAEIFVK